MPGNVFAVSPWTSLDIGKGCAISWGVTFLTNDGHTIFDVRTGQNLNSTEEISRKRKIVVGDHVWIGAHAILLDGADVGSYAVLGAGCVFKGTAEPYGVYVGNPAKKVKTRATSGEYIMDYHPFFR